jgi:hypothetical protein
MSTLQPTVVGDAVAHELSERLADVFRTGHADDVLTDDVFLDGNPPFWRFQLQRRDCFNAWIQSFMPDGVETTVIRTIPTVSGFVTERSCWPSCATAASPRSPSIAAATGMPSCAPAMRPRPNSSGRERKDGDAESS